MVAANGSTRYVGLTDDTIAALTGGGGSGTADTVNLSATTLAALEETAVTNFPAAYPLPDAQVGTLTPQKNALTNAELRAAAVPVTDQHAQALTDAQLRATPVPVSTGLTTQTDALTNVQLRATPVPVDTGLITQTNALTDAQLRATPVSVATPTGLATDAALVPLLDGIEALLAAIRDKADPALTDVQLRATPVSVLVQDTPRTLVTLADATYTASGNTGPLAAGDVSRVAVDITITAVSGVAPEIRFMLDRQGADGRWYPIWTSAVGTAPATITTTVGQGMIVAHSLAAQIRLRWEITGTTPSFTFGGGIVGK